MLNNIKHMATNKIIHGANRIKIDEFPSNAIGLFLPIFCIPRPSILFLSLLVPSASSVVGPLNHTFIDPHLLLPYEKSRS